MSLAPDKKGQPAKAGGRTGHAALVAAGIFLSRVAGLIRESVFAYYFGSSDAADVFRAAFRIPNLLQNLFGEGALSASFIPVYARLLSVKDDREADRVASAVFCLLALVISGLVLIGVLATPLLIDIIAPGFTGAKLELTISLVRILFPGVGLLVMSAWCLGILNSHRRFFLSYAAPVALNLVMIVTLIAFGGRLGQFDLAKALSWGSVAGSGLQFAVQLPQVARLLGSLQITLGLAAESVRTVVRNFFPALVSRGVVQISAYIDTLIASFLPTGGLAGIGYAQIFYTLPVSLFGMSVSAAELPALSGAPGEGDERNSYVRSRLNAALRQIAFFIVPSTMAFLALGDIIAAAVYQRGRFTHHDAVYVWAILAGYSIGLLATTLGRLYASAYWALRDTRTPLYFAVARVGLAAASGYVCALLLPPFLGIDLRWGAVGLTGSAGVSGWVEFLLLRRGLNRRIGKTGVSPSFLSTLCAASGAAAAIAWATKLAVGPGRPLVLAAVSLGLYGIVYFGMAYLLRIPEAEGAIRRAAGAIGLKRLMPARGR